MGDLGEVGLVKRGADRAWTAAVVLAGLLAACPGGEGDGDTSEATTQGDDGTTMVAVGDSTTAPGSSTSAAVDSTTTGDPDSGPGPVTTVTNGMTSNAVTDEGCDLGTLGSDSGRYEFNEASVCIVDQIDRVGMPFVARLLIDSTDEYNAATPADDQFLMFAGEVSGSLAALHVLLDAAITGQGLLPCGLAACNQVTTPLVIPDTIDFDPSSDGGFPNGRHPAEPVFDLMLAALLLDAEAHPLTTYAEMPLSPADNDVPFETTMPYLAPPH